MADSALTALPEVTASNDADLLYSVQNGNSRKTTRAKVIAPTVRHDIDQALLAAAKEKARQNISAAALDSEGIVPRSQLPDSLFAGTGTVDSEAAMLALDVPVGFTAVRTDIDKNFVLNALPASALANWVELASPTAPVLSVAGKQGEVELEVADIIGLDEALQELEVEKFDKPNGSITSYVRGDGSLAEAVTSVAGRTGSITLTKSDVGLGSVDNTSDANKPVSTAQQTELNLKLDKAGNTGLTSTYVWAKSTSGEQTVINAGVVDNTGPSGGGYSRNINHGSSGPLNATSWFEIQHGIWHGWTMAIKREGGTAYFNMRADGSFTAPGAIKGSAKNFEIDHTVDPDNYDLRHCATEAPEMLVEYRGIAKLTNGRVTVNVEDHYGVMTNTFKNLWADAHVHALQNQDGFARVRPSPVDGATFDIICEDETCSDNVAWLVMARRNDPYVRWEGCTFTDDDGRLIIEFEKPE